MFVEWSTDDHMCDAFRTDVHPMTPDGICKWSLHDSKSCTRSEISLIFRVFFSPRIHWMDISTTVAKSSTRCPVTVVSEDKSIEIVFEYTTKESFNTDLGTHTIIELSSLILHFLHLDATIDEFQRYENHKIALLLRVLKRDVNMSIRSTYIGRAQEIHTTEHSGTRTYTWLPTEATPTFDGIGFRRISESYDMEAISHAPDISPRPKQSYTMDNDDFHNVSRVLPVGIMTDETLNLEFFNLKFTPPKCMEVQIPWKEIIDIPAIFTMRDPGTKTIVKKRFSLRFKPEEPQEIGVARYEIPVREGVVARITYERVAADKIAIREIKLIVKRYLLALHYMGEDTSSRTA